jgi:hypothetical protein
LIIVIAHIKKKNMEIKNIEIIKININQTKMKFWIIDIKTIIKEIIKMIIKIIIRLTLIHKITEKIIIITINIVIIIKNLEDIDWNLF